MGADTDAIAGPEELTDDRRAALESLLVRLADDELVIAERYTEWQVRAPTLESDLAVSNIAQDELGHARLWYDLLMDVGYTEAELVFERDPAAFRHATLVELRFAEGDWADAIVRGYLHDTAERLRLDALEGSTYLPIVDRVGKIRGEEAYHRDHARNWLERLTATDDGRERVQDATDRLFPYALALFEGDDDAVEFGFRTASLDEMRGAWLDGVVAFLESLGVRTPIDADGTVPDELLPAAVGRDGSHTDDWFALHDEMTRTYRDLDRTDTRRIMPDPE